MNSCISRWNCYFSSQVLQKPTNDKKQGLVAASRKVADCLGGLVKSAEALKGRIDTLQTYCSTAVVVVVEI